MEAAITHPVENKTRIISIDLVRGIIMVIMALDHVRDYFHQSAFVFKPTDLDKTYPVLFFTRFATHFCAPTFIFLAGTSIYISRQRKSTKELSLFLWTRGLWLIVLEVVVLRFAFVFNFYYDVTLLSILWVAGASMIILAGLIYLSDKVVLVIGLVILFGHDLVSWQPAVESIFYVPWSMLMRLNFIPLTPDFALLINYPVVPWLGIMLLGYFAGTQFTPQTDPAKRRKFLRVVGFAAIGLFIVLRLINIYGDPVPWATQKDFVFTVMSFLNVSKYPPSLLFALITLGPMLILLAALDKVRSRIANPFITFGRVPLFYFLGHFFLAHTVALLLFLHKTGKSFSSLDLHFSKSFGGITPEGGYSLPWVYVAWIAVVIIMYPICRWYEKYKAGHKEWWLSYL
jgi:uncharacterized membrane protein